MNLSQERERLVEKEEKFHDSYRHLSLPCILLLHLLPLIRFFFSASRIVIVSSWKKQALLFYTTHKVNIINPSKAPKTNCRLLYLSSNLQWESCNDPTSIRGQVMSAISISTHHDERIMRLSCHFRKMYRYCEKCSNSIIPLFCYQRYPTREYHQV